MTRRTIKYNPARAIERPIGANTHRGEFDRVRLDEVIEEKLFEVVLQLNRSRVGETIKNPRDAQEAARHKRLETTQRYMHRRRDRRWEVAQALNR